LMSGKAQGSGLRVGIRYSVLLYTKISKI